MDECQALNQQFEQIKLDCISLTGGVDDFEFNWRRESEGWSIAQCVDHLIVTGRLYLPYVDTAIARAKVQQQSGRRLHRYGVMERWFLRSLEPPPGPRFRTPKLFRPARHELHALETVDVFLALQDDFVSRLRRAQGIDLRRTKVRSPMSPLIRFSLGIVFALNAAHARRHLWQIQQMKHAYVQSKRHL